MVNIAADVWAHAETQPDKTAVRSFTQTVSFRDLRDAGARLAGAVRAAGITPGDRVLLVAPSVPTFAVVYYGLHAAGATVITMNTMSTPAEIGYVLEDAGASLVIAWHQCATSAQEAAQERDLPVWVVDEGTTWDADPLTEVHDHAPDDTCLILYTSGTTGRPKGAELTAHNLVAAAPTLEPYLNLTDDDRFGTGLPLFHVFGQSAVMNAVLARGASLSLLHPFHPAAMLQLIVEHELTGVSGVPTMWNAMLHAETPYTAADFTHLRLASSGGAAIPVEVMEAFERRFGAAIIEGYGLTESNALATFNDLNRPRKPGTVGPALPGFEIEIRSLMGDVLGVDEVGEVVLKGPTIFKEYRNRPDATAEALEDGWFRTGDLGALDADGYLRIVDRTKDLIIRGGYNVYPREVEEVLYAHPDVVEAAVIGIPDEHYGEEVTAVVVRRAGSTADEAALDAYLREQLSAYKVPRVYSFVDELPKGATGKILKRAIDRSALTKGAR